GHADPTLQPHLAAELGTEAMIVSGFVGMVAAGGDLLGEEAAHLGAQRFAFGRQADRIKGQFARHVAVLIVMPATATVRRCRAPPPRSPSARPRRFHCRSRRATPTAVA